MKKEYAICNMNTNLKFKKIGVNDFYKVILNWLRLKIINNIKL